MKKVINKNEASHVKSVRQIIDQNIAAAEKAHKERMKDLEATKPADPVVYEVVEEVGEEEFKEVSNGDSAFVAAPNSIILRHPDGTVFAVHSDDFEKNWELES